jgi:hypothetical protein
MKQRVEVKFECEARRITHSDNWECYLPEADRWVNIPGQYVKPIMAVEPTESAFYKFTYANGHKGVAHRTSNFWYLTGVQGEHSWEELGNIIEVEKIEL